MRIGKFVSNVFKLSVTLMLLAYGPVAQAVSSGAAREIPFSSLEGVRVGNAQNNGAKTGVTVLCFPAGALTGVDISGGGPASRETPVLDPTKENIGIHAIVLSGGSAYGLAASDGVMQCLEERGIGYDTGFAKVPLVVQSSIYDLSYGSPKVRPDKKMGYEACRDALENGKPQSGSVGSGTGATVGKLCGMEQSMKSGIGYYAVQMGALKVGAVVVVNALGDVYSVTTGKKIAGLLNKERTAFSDSAAELYRIAKPQDLFSRTNTTIGAIITNGKFDKAELTRIAGQTRNAYARAINPVGTLADGDTIYAVSCGDPVTADINMTGTLAAEVMAKAIENAVAAAKMDDAEYLRHCLSLPSHTKDQEAT